MEVKKAISKAEEIINKLEGINEIATMNDPIANEFLAINDSSSSQDVQGLIMSITKS
jgi:hypothetical protein